MGQVRALRGLCGCLSCAAPRLVHFLPATHGLRPFDFAQRRLWALFFHASRLRLGGVCLTVAHKI